MQTLKRLDEAKMEEITEQVHRLRELRAQEDELRHTIESLEQNLKCTMIENHLEQLSGVDWKMSYITYTTHRFDTKRFKKENSELYESYLLASEQKRFTLK